MPKRSNVRFCGVTPVSSYFQFQLVEHVKHPRPILQRPLGEWARQPQYLSKLLCERPAKEVLHKRCHVDARESYGLLLPRGQA